MDNNGYLNKTTKIINSKNTLSKDTWHILLDNLYLM